MLLSKNYDKLLSSPRMGLKAKGRAMYSIHSDFESSKILRFVRNLINDNGYTSFDDLCHAEKCEFAALLIEAAGSKAEHEFLTENNHLDQIISKFRKALTGLSIDDDDFVDAIKESAINYYEPIMVALFDDQLSELLAYKEGAA